jgi:ATP-binding cassette, subfamily B, bacterial PglK
MSHRIPISSEFHLTKKIALEWKSQTIDALRLTQIVESTALEEVAGRFGTEINSQMSDSVTSGGQRQRIGLARSLYRKPTLLVLDEVTSSLDTATEHFVMQHVQSLRGATTVIIVAHRLTTVQHADRVIYIENGTVLGVGSFDELRQSVPQLQRMIELGTLNLSN